MTLRDILGPKLRTYEPAVVQMLAWFSPREWLAQHVFDALCRQHRIMDRAWFLECESVVLGEPGGRKKELDLLQHLVLLGLVEAKIDQSTGLVLYRRTGV